MLPKLFLLFVSLATGHFTDITSNFPHNGVAYYAGPIAQFPMDNTDENEAIRLCEERCLVAKYFCKVFMVFMEGEDAMCELFGTPISHLSCYVDDRNGPLKIFELSGLELEPVEERFSHDHHSEPQWIGDLVKGYGFDSYDKRISNGFFENVIKGCTAVMNSKRSTARARHFNVNENAVSDLVAFSGDKNLEPKSPSESFANVVFTFLGVFLQQIGSDIKTIYDPIKNQLSIRGQNVDMLVVSFGLRDYAIVRDAPNNPAQPLMVYVSNTRRRLDNRYDDGTVDAKDGNPDDEEDYVEEDVDEGVDDDVDHEDVDHEDVDHEDVDHEDVDHEDVDHDVDHDDVYSDDVDDDVDDDSLHSAPVSDLVNVEEYYDGYEDHDIVALFQQAMKTTSQYGNVKYKLFDCSADIDGQTIAILVLNYVLHALLEPERISHVYPKHPNGREFIFYRDLVTVVLSKVYAQAETATVRSKLHSKIKEMKYNDLEIITQV